MFPSSVLNVLLAAAVAAAAKRGLGLLRRRRVWQLAWAIKLAMGATSWAYFRHLRHVHPQRMSA
jgi:hypothetical protein